MSLHMGRSWSDTRLEDDCPCPKAPCGLVVADNVAPLCPQHGHGTARTMRQLHDSDDCPDGLRMRLSDAICSWDRDALADDNNEENLLNHLMRELEKP